MERFLDASALYYKNITSHRKAVFFIGAFVFIALFLIPNEKSGYVTFYIGKVTGIANNMWVSNLNAIFSNILLALFGFFLFEGIADDEYGNNRLVRVSSSSNFFILVHRWFTYVLTLLLFGLIITITTLLINYKDFNIFSFLYPFFYFTIPFIFILVSLIIVIDSVIKKRIIKILLFIGIIIFLLVPITINKSIDLFGVYEFMKYIEKDVEGSNFAIGYIRKTSQISFVEIEQHYIKSNLLIRLSLIPISLLLIYLHSFVFDRYRKKKVVNRLKIDQNRVVTENVGNHPVALKLKTVSEQANLLNLFNAFFLLFKKAFSRLQIIIIVVLWVMSFLINYETARNITIPLIFLTSFS